MEEVVPIEELPLFFQIIPLYLRVQNGTDYKRTI